MTGRFFLLRRSAATAAPALATAAILLTLNAGLDPSFLSPRFWAGILAVAAPFMVISMAAAPAIVSGRGGIDLSIGPTAGLVNAVLVGVLFDAGITSPPAALAATLGVGATVGAINGVLVAWARVPAIIVTLGTYLAVSGLTLEILPMAGGQAPGWVIALGGSWAGVPLPVLPIIGAAAIWSIPMATRYGRNLRATGSDPRTAFASGVDVARVRALAFVLSGALAGVGGLAFTVALGSGDPTAAPSYTLIGIAGAVLGGVALSGGRGGLLGAAAGGAVLFLVQNLLSLAHVSAFYSQIAYGAILIAALWLSRLIGRLRR